MNTYAIVGGTLWGNRGAEAMVVTTIGRVRERDPGASFVLLSYLPDKDRELLKDPGVTVVDARPKATVVSWVVAVLCGILKKAGLRLPDGLVPVPLRELRRSRALFDVSGISFHDGRLTVVAYNLLCLWPAILIGVPVIRLSQAMGPFRHPLNRLPARWVTRKSLHTFARGRLTAEFMEGLGLPTGSWSVAPDVAFAYLPQYSLTTENDAEVARLRERLAGLANGGAAVVALVPSSVVDQKMARSGGDYVQLLAGVVGDLVRREVHVVVMPNATRAGSDAPRNNDIVVIKRLRAHLTDEVDDSMVSWVDFDLNTSSIRSLASQCLLVITSRFHAMVAALAVGVPPLVLGWSHKYEEVLEMFGRAGDALDFVAAETELPALLQRMLAEHETIRTEIDEALPSVTAEAISQFDVVDRLPTT